MNSSIGTRHYLYNGDYSFNNLADAMSMFVTDKLIEHIVIFDDATVNLTGSIGKEVIITSVVVTNDNRQIIYSIEEKQKLIDKFNELSLEQSE